MLYTNEQIKKRIDKEKKKKKIIAVIVYILLTPIMVYNIALIISSIVKPNKTPSFLGIKTYVIISGSMEPNISVGDIVIARNIKNEERELKIGDIISFRSGHSVITHRIVNIEKDNNGVLRIRTKGDSNNTEDGVDILINNIEGKVIAVIPKIGSIVRLLHDRTVLMIFLVVVYIYIIKSFKKNQRKNNRRLKRLKFEENNRR